MATRKKRSSKNLPRAEKFDFQGLYTEEKARFAIAEVSKGSTYMDVCAAWGYPPNTISAWMGHKDTKVDGVPFRDAMIQAKEARAHLMMEKVVRDAEVMPDEVRDMVNDGKSHKIANAYVNAKARQFAVAQWMAERLAPEIYGPKLQHSGKIEHGITVNVTTFAEPSEIVDSDVIDVVESPKIEQNH